MSVFKVVARCPKKGTQVKKKVYETNDKYYKYGRDLIHRWSEIWNVEVCTIKEEEYAFVYSIDAPRTKEELKNMAEERGYSEAWVTYKLRDL